MTADELDALVARIAQRLGLPILPLSLPRIARLVRRDGDGAGLTHEVIADRVAALVADPKERQHFDLKAAPQKGKPAALLEHANRIAAAVSPPRPPQKRTLTEEQRAWRDKYGAQALFDRWPELNFEGAPHFILEDEGYA